MTKKKKKAVEKFDDDAEITRWLVFCDRFSASPIYVDAATPRDAAKGAMLIELGEASTYDGDFFEATVFVTPLNQVGSFLIEVPGIEITPA